MTLADIKPGDSFKIIRITLIREIGKRLADMGLIRGTAGRLIRVAHVGDPIEIEMSGIHISLRKSEAKGIEIEQVTQKGTKNE
jgi:ferrous iron transport protein A